MIDWNLSMETAPKDGTPVLQWARPWAHPQGGIKEREAMKETYYEALDRIMSVPDEVAMPAHGTSLDLLREVYRDQRQPLSVRMRAAVAALPFEHPKLSVTGTAHLASGFANRLEALMQSRGISAVIDATPFRKVEVSDEKD
jgi:hypothetical protein